MTDYNMTTGMSGWMAKYNQFVTDNVITDTGWIDTGITYQNGIRQDLDATGTLYFTARSGVSKATFFVDSVYVVGAEVTS